MNFKDESKYINYLVILDEHGKPIVRPRKQAIWLIHSKSSNGGRIVVPVLNDCGPEEVILANPVKLENEH